MNRWFLPSIISILAAWVCSYSNTDSRLFIKHAIAIALRLGLFWIATRLPILKRIFEHPGGWSQVPSSFWWFHRCYRQNSKNPLIPVVGDFRLQPSQFVSVFVGIKHESSIKSKNRLTQGTLSSILQFATIAIPQPWSRSSRSGTLFFFQYTILVVSWWHTFWKHLALSLPSLEQYWHFAQGSSCYIRIKTTSHLVLYPAQAGQNETYNLRQSLIGDWRKRPDR